jgi:hypothetical protein
VVSGYGETNLLKKLLTNLYKRFFPIKAEPWEELLITYSQGETPRQTDPDRDFAYDDFVDDVTGEFVRVHIVCSCDKGVIRIDGGDTFKCLHCDQPCWSRSCQECRRLYSVDYG